MAPTSSLSSSARRALRAAAHHLDPVVMIGQHGLTATVLHEIDLALTAHALIKVRVQSDERETREAFLAEICQKMGCESVQHLGKLLVLWRNAGESGDDDVAAGQDAVAVKAASGRGPRSKLPRQATASAPPSRAPRSAAARGADEGRSGRESNATGERRRYGEPIPPPPRREGWAPKNRRGAARFGGDDGADGGSNAGYSRRRDAGEGFDAPRGRAPAGGGRGASRGEFAAPPRGRTGGASGAGGSGYGRSGTGATTGSRWGERRDFDDRGTSGGRSRTGGDGGGFAGDTGGGRRPPSSRQGGDSWGNRDGFSGKPRGFAPRGAGAAGGRGPASGSPAAKPRARRRLG